MFGFHSELNESPYSLPQLRQDVDRLLASCLEEIGTLPKTLDVDPQFEVLTKVGEFCDAFKGAVSGASSDKSLVQRNRALYTLFARDIRGTSPDFRPFEDPIQHSLIDALDSEERSEVRNDLVQVMGLYDVRKTIKEYVPYSPFPSYAYAWYRSIAWELPGNIPYAAKTRLIDQFTGLWSAPAEKCLASINDVLDDFIQQLSKAHLGRFRALQNLVSYVFGDVITRKDLIWNISHFQRSHPS